MKKLDDFNFSGKRAIVRVDFNVPLNANFQITDDSRIRAAIPTIQKILSDGGSVILMSHLGRPKGGYEEKYSLKHLAPRISKLLKINVAFAVDCIGREAEDMAKNLRSGEVLLLENLRFHKEEEEGNPDFAGKLAKLADIYVNDAFGTAHRAHASTAIIADLFPENKTFGYLIANELESIDKVLDHPNHPLTAVLGGAKVSSKISILTNLLNKVDNLIIGGGMAYTFIKAQGGKVGSSLIEEDKLEMAQSILNEAKSKNVKIYLPVDAIIADKFDGDANSKSSPSNAIPNEWMGLDIGPESIKQFQKVILTSKTILWNGPMGVFEMPKFEQGTKEIANSIAEVTPKGCFTLVGGGDSVAAINKYDLAEKVSYVSTGGGAMLEYIEGQDLPGIKAIRGN